MDKWVPMIRCVLFDLDGVLVEARDWHYFALNKALKQVSRTEIGLDEHLTTFNGLPTAKKLDMLEIMGRIKEEHKDKIWKLKQDFTIETIEEMGCVDEEKVNMMKYLKEKGIKIGCVTNSIRKTASLMLKVTGQLDFIDILISNEDVIKPKPHPEGYIFAINAFCCLPHRALIVEDSDYGIEAATKSKANIMRVSCAEDVTKESISKQLEKYEI